MTRCTTPLSLAELLAYERGDTDSTAAERIEQHLFECTECAARLEALIVLGESVGALARRGKLSSSAPLSTLERAAARGLRVRVYRLEPGDTVQCTAAQDDDFVALRLAVNVEADESVDVVVVPPEGAEGAEGAQGADSAASSPAGEKTDVLVDRARGEVVYLHSAELVRTFPKSVWPLRLRIRGPRGERWSGPYLLDHTPWNELQT